MKNKFTFTIKAGEVMPLEWQTAMYKWRRVKITVEKLPDVESVAKTLNRFKKMAKKK